MPSNNRVIWSGVVMPHPEHFQQQERYFERYIETQFHALAAHGWGFVDVEVERELLVDGRFGLRRATAIFQDGTPVRFPDDDPTPSPIDLDSGVRDEVIFLTLPARHAEPQTDPTDGTRNVSRQPVREIEAIAVPSKVGAPSPVVIGGLRTQLFCASEVTAAYLAIPIARIRERRADKIAVLEEGFIPTVLQCRAAPQLRTFLNQLLELLRQRGDALNDRVSSTARGGSAELVEFLMLQAINRYEPLVAHLAQLATLHPEDFYRVCVMVSGELSTFSSATKRPAAFVGYAHGDLQKSFEPVMSALRRSLSAVLDQAAVPIPIESKKFGIHVAVVSDRTLYSAAVFVLAARADMPAEDLRKRFPTQVKIGTVEHIRSLVNLQLAGVPMQQLPVAPRQIPYHAGFVYFEFDQGNELWGQLKGSGGLAIHVSGDFPGLTLELWAIRT